MGNEYKKSIFQKELMGWYDREKRDLPWRETSDPYAIWLSEIILQQTRVAQGLPYYYSFLEAFPTVFELAAAQEQEVLRLWQGLGYYSRARNLHHCAKEVVREYGGEFPSNYTELLRLKGVGKYTAAAIASFAFGEKVAAIDGNVYRVMARVFGMAEDIASYAGQKQFQKLGNKLVPDVDPGKYNQAVIEFGAMHCKPKNPSCETCPIRAVCSAYKDEAVQELPVKIKKIKIRDRYFNYLILETAHGFIMGERHSGDIWQGLYDFPLQESECDINESAVIDSLVLKDALLLKTSKIYRHILTHQRIFAKFFHFRIGDEAANGFLRKDKRFRLCHRTHLDQLPKPRLIVNYLEEQGF